MEQTAGENFKERKEKFSKKVEGKPLSKEMIESCLTYYPEDEVMAEKILEEITSLKKRVSELEGK